MTLLPEVKRLSWPRYFHARTYRNPYVKIKGKSRKPQPKCIDCATFVHISGSRCRRCYGLSQRRDNTTTTRVLAAAKSGKFTTQTCVAAEIGISRERVRQILNAAGDTEFGHRRNFRLEWPCPECEAPISLTRYQFARLIHMPAHCRSCAKNYCLQGHLRSEYANKRGICLPCQNIRARLIVEVRTCIACNKDLEISAGTLRQIKLGKAAGKYHRKCYDSHLKELHTQRRRR